MERNGLLQSNVVERKNIRAQLVEDQKHLGGPYANTTHRRQLGNDLCVAHGRPTIRMNLPGAEVSRQIAKILDLPRRKAATTQHIVCAGEDFGRSHDRQCCGQPLPYAVSGFHRNLLSHDGAGQRNEGIAA